MKHFRSFLRFPLLPVWLTPLVLLAPVYLTGRAIFWGTPLLQFVPWWKLAWDTLLAGHLPLWNPYVGMGAPLLANYQSALFYPPTWVYFLFYALGGLGAMVWVQALLLALHLAWAGLGMAFLVRRLGLGELAQALAGLAYGLSGYLVARAGFLSINAAAAWLPWIILCLTPLPEPLRLRSKRFGWAAICIAMQLLSGHAQTTWYSLVLAGLWVAFWGWNSAGSAAGAENQPPLADNRRLTRLQSVVRAELVMGLAVLLAVALAAVQLLPTAEYLAQSQRASAVEYDYAMNYSFWPWHLLTLLAPGMFGSPASGDYWGFANYWEDAIYVGLLPLLLALGVLFRRAAAGVPAAPQAPACPIPLRRSFKWFLFGLMAVALLLALGSNTPLFPWLYRHVPTFAMFQAPTRWMIWVVAVLPLLAALGADGWRRPQGRGLYWTRLGTMGAFAITLGAGLGWMALGDVSPSFVRATAILGWWALLAGILSLSAPPRPGAVQRVEAPRQASALRVKALAGLENRLGQGVASLAARFNPPGGPYPLRRWQMAVAVVVAADLLLAGWGLNPGGDRSIYTQPAPTAEWLHRVAANRRVYILPGQENWIKYARFLRFNTFDPGQAWLDMRAAMLPDANILDGVYTTGNFDPLLPGRYVDWMDALAPAPPGRQAALLQAMDVGVVISPHRRLPHGLKLEETGTPTRRLGWVGCALPATTPEQARQMVFERDLDLTRQVVLEGQDDVLTPCSPAQLAIPLVHPVEQPTGSPNHLEMKVSSLVPGYVVVADTWYPGWRAWVDGQPVDLLQANYLFRGVAVPSGMHTLVMAYRPVSFYAGLVISLLAWLVSLAWFKRSVW